jgi:pilus assembly protein Flp/PilA
MTKLFARFVKDESGATAIEYGLIAALISVALITGASTLGNALDNQFSAVAGKLTLGAPAAGGGADD